MIEEVLNYLVLLDYLIIFYNAGKNIAKLDTGIITTYSLYITIGLLSLILLVFTPMLMDSTVFIEMRLFIIYLVSSMVILFA